MQAQRRSEQPGRRDGAAGAGGERPPERRQSRGGRAAPVERPRGVGEGPPGGRQGQRLRRDPGQRGTKGRRRRRGGDRGLKLRWRPRPHKAEAKRRYGLGGIQKERCQKKRQLTCLLGRGVGSTSAGAAAPLKFTLAGMVLAYLKAKKKHQPPKNPTNPPPPPMRTPKIKRSEVLWHSGVRYSSG